MVRAFMILGGVLVGTSVLGKSFIHLYRSIKLRNAFVSQFALGKHYRGAFQANMDRREAFLILGLNETQNQEKIVTAHKRLMVQNHPDNAGSTFLATKINEAKELLITGKSSSEDSFLVNAQHMKRSLSQDETSFFSDFVNQSHFRVDKKSYLTRQCDAVNVNQKSKEQSNFYQTIQISIDRHTLKRQTIYDRAKLRVYLEQCRQMRKKAEFDKVNVKEEDLRQAIQDLHELESQDTSEDRENLQERLSKALRDNRVLTEQVVELQLLLNHYQNNSSPVQDEEGIQRLSNPSCFSLDIDQNNLESSIQTSGFKSDSQFRLAQNIQEHAYQLDQFTSTVFKNPEVGQLENKLIHQNQVDQVSFDARQECSQFNTINYLSGFQQSSFIQTNPILFQGSKLNGNGSSLTFSYSPYNPEEETQKLMNLHDINEEINRDYELRQKQLQQRLNFNQSLDNTQLRLRLQKCQIDDNHLQILNDIHKDSVDHNRQQSSTMDKHFFSVESQDDRADCQEGGIHKQCCNTVGSMAQLKHPSRMIVPDMQVKTFDMINQNTATARFDRESFGIGQVNDFEDTQRLSTLLKNKKEEVNTIHETRFIPHDQRKTQKQIPKNMRSRNNLQQENEKVTLQNNSKSFIEARKCIDNLQHKQNNCHFPNNIASNSTIATQSQLQSFKKLTEESPSKLQRFFSNNDYLDPQLIHQISFQHNREGSQISNGFSFLPLQTQTQSSFIVFDALNGTQSVQGLNLMGDGSKGLNYNYQQYQNMLNNNQTSFSAHASNLGVGEYNSNRSNSHILNTGNMKSQIMNKIQANQHQSNNYCNQILTSESSNHETYINQQYQHYIPVDQKQRQAQNIRQL
eukprot:403375966